VTERLLFISDLHLQDSRPDITAALLRFLERNTGKTDALYILGDLFELWIGDDAQDALALRVAAALKAISENGARINLMHGNRDFLMGEDFARACGAELLADPTVIETSAGAIILSHGDALCVDDHDYQAFRQQVRNPQWQAAFLARGLSERRAYAEQARQQSKQATAGKSMGIMDVNQQAVLELLQEQQQSRLLHGHTHRPARHSIQLDAPIGGTSEAMRLVLGDWDEKLWYAEISDGEITLHEQALSA
jgi:UDP-2,3-diacylglucosamine hydrolase